MKGTSSDKFDKKNKDKGFAKGNTLDYYNDDMSRKAVGKLFNDKADDDDFPGDFESASEKGKSSPSHSSGSKTSEPPAADEANEFIDLDELETYIQKKHVNISSVFEDTQDNNYDISMYRDKKKGTPANVPSGKTTPSTMKPVAGKAQSAVIPGKSTAKDRNSKFRLDSAYNSASEPKAAIIAGEISSQIKVAAIVIIIVFLAILAALVYKMNSLSASLETANKTAELYNPDLERSYNELKISFGALESENTRLLNELELAKQNAAVTAPPTGTDIVDQTIPTVSPGTTATTAPPTTQPQGTSNYEVVRGDTLYGISLKVYGSAGHIDKIKEANGLTNDNIQPGQILKIPQI